VTCLRSHDHELWEILVHRLQPVFARIIYRVASSSGTARADEVDDLVQDCFVKLEATREGLFIQASAFDNEQSALGYLRMMAANTARDYFRRKRAEKRGTAITVSVDDQVQEIAGAKSQNPETTVLMGQIDRLLGADSDGRTIFWLYYRQGFTAKEIAGISTFGLSAKGVESLIRRLTLVVREKLNCEPEGTFGRETF
jgi:RNA polymerase sigma-70 factor, ECF subfamily